MKSLLICPDQRLGVAALSEFVPLSNVPILGKCLLEYWIEYLVTLGAKEILILATDRPDHVRALVGDGARWGLRVTVLSEDRELTIAEARSKHRGRNTEGWLSAPDDAVMLDCLPNLPRSPILTSYANWFAAVRALLLQALTPDRIGVHELQPGVWVGLHTHIAPNIRLIAPCWIGEHVWIEAGAVIGPNVALEKEVFVSRGAEISQSAIGPDTFVGQFTEIQNSIAWGSTLINWERDSCLKVPDEFLLCSLAPHRMRPEEARKTTPRPVRLPAVLRLREHFSELLASLYAKISPPC
jgi:NDP-sugar pyrophosphorylase family protein